MIEDLFTNFKIGDFLYDKEGLLARKSANSIYRLVSLESRSFNINNFYSPSNESEEELSYKLGYIARNGSFATFYSDFNVLSNLEIITHDKAKEIIRKDNEAVLKGVLKYDKILKRVFPGNAVTSLSNNGSIHSWIRIPEEVITNNSGLSTTIRDMVFRIKYAEQGNGEYVIANIKAQGFTATEKQICARYLHSHVTSSGLFDWSNCCFGGTQLSSTFASLNVKLEEIKFEMFLYQLKDYVKHESLKGGPYVKISSIYNNNYYSSRVSSEDLDTCFNSICRNKFKIKLNVSSVDKSINCSFEKESLNKALYDSGCVPSMFLGKTSDGHFMPNESGSLSGDEINRFLHLNGLCVSDGECSIDLKKKVYNEEPVEKMEDIENAVSPEFLIAFEARFKTKFEAFIIDEIINKNERKRKREESEVNNNSKTFSYGELPA